MINDFCIASLVCGKSVGRRWIPSQLIICTELCYSINIFGVAGASSVDCLVVSALLAQCAVIPLIASQFSSQMISSVDSDIFLHVCLTKCWTSSRVASEFYTHGVHMILLLRVVVIS